MAVINKPSDINKIWADGGDKVAPSDVKIDTGWEVEVPPRQYFNWLDNKQDQFNAHVNQHGIAVWDATTEYLAGKSYTQGSDGKVYKSVAASGPSGVVQNPTTDATDTYWVVAFADNILATETVPGVVELATALEAQQFVANKFIDGAKLAEAFKGSNVSLATSGYQKLPSGLIIQWGSVVVSAATNATVTLSVAFPSAVLGAFATPVLIAGAGGVGVNTLTTSNFKVWNGYASPLTVYWMAIGY